MRIFQVVKQRDQVTPQDPIKIRNSVPVAGRGTSFIARSRQQTPRT